MYIFLNVLFVWIKFISVLKSTVIRSKYNRKIDKERHSTLIVEHVMAQNERNEDRQTSSSYSPSVLPVVVECRCR